MNERSERKDQLRAQGAEFTSTHTYSLPIEITPDGNTFYNYTIHVIERKKKGAETADVVYHEVMVTHPQGDVIFHLDESFYPLTATANLEGAEAGIVDNLQRKVQQQWGAVVETVIAADTDEAAASKLAQLLG